MNIFIVVASRTNQYGIPLETLTKVFDNEDLANAQAREWHPENMHLEGNSIDVIKHEVITGADNIPSPYDDSDDMAMYESDDNIPF